MIFETASTVSHFGHKIDFYLPDPRQIDLRDLAWHLSGISADPAARFPDSYNGTYSLAQRACLIAKTVAKESVLAAIYGMLDGAPAAYMQHLFSHTPPAELSFDRVWAHLQDATCIAFGLKRPIPDGFRTAITVAANRVRTTELRLLRDNVDETIRALEQNGYLPVRHSIVQIARDKAYDQYLETFVRLADGAGLDVTHAWAKVPCKRS
jgi:hypothetical protein